ncbi:C40 family peptidase [Cellulomonas hominis]|uniref:C40 family peptidase n=1 Tax=Cellulomonas hominis TaxID=156981 RepID=UPI001B9D2BF6|nr:C40 family peptidase [Cellulomonas hominis]VTR77542.1 Gamma-D-glutamyl-L-lysine endopeptidase [Cellulomonas hominis]
MSNPITAVQARISEIRQIVTPVTVTASTATAASGRPASAVPATPTTPATDATFAAALAQASGAGTALDESCSIAPGSGVTGQDLVASAKKYLGTPYVWGGESLAEGGLDCSGLVQRALADLGVTGVPRVARDQATIGTEVPSLDQALPGDLVVLGGGKHIGIYVGGGQMIDAPKPGKAVTIRDVYAEPTTIRRILPQAGATAAATTVSATTGLSGALASTAAGQNALALLTGSASGGSALSSLSTSSLWGAAS